MTQNIPRRTCVTARRYSISSLQQRSLPMRFSHFWNAEETYWWTLFCIGEYVYDWVKNWYGRQSTTFFKNGIDRLLTQWDNFINNVSDYFCGNKCFIIRFWHLTRFHLTVPNILRLVFKAMHILRYYCYDATRRRL